MLPPSPYVLLHRHDCLVGEGILRNYHRECCCESCIVWEWEKKQSRLFAPSSDGPVLAARGLREIPSRHPRLSDPVPMTDRPAPSRLRVVCRRALQGTDRQDTGTPWHQDSVIIRERISGKSLAGPIGPGSDRQTPGGTGGRWSVVMLCVPL